MNEGFCLLITQPKYLVSGHLFGTSDANPVEYIFTNANIMHFSLGIPLNFLMKKSFRAGFALPRVELLCFDDTTTQEVHAMAITIRPEDVRAALEPMLGTRFVLSTPICGDTAYCLSLYAPSCMTLDDMYARVKECIFGCLYDTLGQGMVLTLENGVRLRLRLKDVDTLADAALGVLLDALPGAQLPLEFLRSYALDSGLLCAMRVLLQRYGAVLPSMEREMLGRIIRENHPADRYSSWLE